MTPTSPRWSVIVAAYRSDAVIGACLEALCTQSLPDFEVIVVNSFQRDRTAQIVRRDFPSVRLVDSADRLLPHAARNRGVKEAGGKFLAFTDADCQADPDWLEHLDRAQSAGHDVVCGSIDLEGSGYYARGVHLCKYSFRLSGLPAGPCTIAGTANASYSRKAWARVGPFDGTRFSGDALLSLRAGRSGLQPWFEPKARVRHRFADRFGDFLCERIGRGRDFADMRMGIEDWSRLRAAGYTMAFPFLPCVPLVRSARDASLAGWVGSFAATLPLQYLGTSPGPSGSWGRTSSTLSPST